MDGNGRVGIGVVGCGVISEIYLKNLTGGLEGSEAVRVAAVADALPERAQQRADQFKEFGVRALSVDELLADPAVDLVLNLTIPAAHAEVGRRALEAGKSLYTEKPLTIERADARALLDLARERNLLVGSAPDTFLGGGLQTCRALLDEGAIGAPVAATAFMLSHGPESWHPAPEFFYLHGGGPLLDMGPYYLTALVSLIGPVRRVTGSVRASFPERTVTSGPGPARQIPVETPTHHAAVLDFAGGAIGTLVTSFDVWAAEVPRLEIYGSTGTLSLPDPNTFGGPVRLHRAGATGWEDVPLSHGFAENSRGLGLVDMAQALRDGRPHRASGALAAHVLDVMHAVGTASDTGRHVDLDSQPERPVPLPSELTARAGRT